MTAPAPAPAPTPLLQIRIKKGEATPEELAALTVLLTRITTLPRPTAASPAAARTSWQPNDFPAPHSWQAPAE